MARALALAEDLGFEHSCEPEAGPLLHLLAAQRGRMRVGEIGTGVGVGAAWIVSALSPEVPFVTVEADEARAAAAAGLFAEDEHVRVLHGDWHEAMPPQAPFDLLFSSGGGKPHPEADGDDVVGLLAPGGTLLLDGLRLDRGPPGVDSVREFWLAHPQLATAELAVSPALRVIVAVRTR